LVLDSAEWTKHGVAIEWRWDHFELASGCKVQQYTQPISMLDWGSNSWYRPVQWGCRLPLTQQCYKAALAVLCGQQWSALDQRRLL
jgi:hypothetical protein